jgi:hypothetical protein
MALALRINVDSTIEEIRIDDVIHTLQTQTAYPHEEYKLLERYEVFDDCWLYLYGMLNTSHPFNEYEFQYFNMTGDVFVLMVSETGEFLDLSEEQFIGYYDFIIDLDDTIIEDELSETDDESYDSSFVEEDR